MSAPSTVTSTTPTALAVEITAAINRLPSTTGCLLYTSDAADERSSVDLGGRRIIKKKTKGDTYIIRTYEHITI